MDNKNIDRLEEKQAKCLAKWNSLNVPLHEGETVVQMVNHNPVYFLSSEGRVFSVAKRDGKEWRELKTTTKISKNATSKTGSNRQLCVGLWVNGEVPIIRISKLMAEYFPLSVFNPTNDSRLETHHIEPWDDEKGTDNNRLENLQRVSKQAHDVLTMLQKGKMTVNGTMKHKNEELFIKKFAALLDDVPIGAAQRYDPETLTIHGTFAALLDDVPIGAAQRYDPETLTIHGTWGFMPKPEELEKLKILNGVITMDPEYVERMKDQEEAMKLIQNGEATGKVRIVNGVPQLIKEEKEKKENEE